MISKLVKSLHPVTTGGPQHFRTIPRMDPRMVIGLITAKPISGLYIVHRIGCVSKFHVKLKLPETIYIDIQ